MSAGSFIIRNFYSADLQQYVRLHVEANSFCHSDDSLFFASLRRLPSKPAGFSDEDIFLAEKYGTIAGACRVVPEPAIDRAVLRLFVIPRFAERGVVTELLLAAIHRVAQLNLLKVQADLRENDQAARDLFANLGFKPVRRYSEMTLNLRGAPMVESRVHGLSFGPLEPGREAEFTQLQNHVFEGSWGFCPNSTSDILQLLNTPGYNHDGVVIAHKAKKVAGYCWTAKRRVLNGKCGEMIGRVHMMGVVQEFRGQGLAKHILWAGLRHLAEQGEEKVELTVDNENAAACAVYKRAGFKLKMPLVWYEKRLV